MPPDMVRFVPQNGRDSDCGVATIGTLFGLDRDEALLLCGAVAPAVLIEGMSRDEIDAALSTMAVKYRWQEPGEYDLDEATGVLAVGNRKIEHYTLLWAGRIVDGNGEHWLDPRDYLTHYRYTARELLVRTDD